MKKMISTSSIEYYASFAGAILLSFGLGVLFAGYFENYALVVAAVGLVLHSFGMYKMYK